jgi:hypothetical protein
MTLAGVWSPCRKMSTKMNSLEQTIPFSRVRVVEFDPPASPYIKISFEGNLMYELTGCFIENYFKYADPTFSEFRYLLVSYFTGMSELISRVALWTDGPGRKRNEHPDRGMTLNATLLSVILL